LGERNARQSSSSGGTRLNLIGERKAREGATLTEVVTGKTGMGNEFGVRVASIKGRTPGKVMKSALGDTGLQVLKSRWCCLADKARALLVIFS